MFETNNPLFENQDEDRNVLVIGATSVDIVGRLTQGIEVGTSNPAQIRTTFGGTARNFAENLARLGQSVTLISAVGKDQMGSQALESTALSGVDTTHVIETEEFPTSSYLAVVDQDGDLNFALDDMNVINCLTPAYIEEKADLFHEATLLFLDANLPEETLAAAMQLALEAHLVVAADPTSTSLTPRLIPYLPNIYLITPNHKEASILCDHPVSADESRDALEASKILVNKGVAFSIVTQAEFGLAYATSETQGHIPAIRTKIVDPTGGGDALSAAVVFSLLNGISADEAVRLGVSAASLTLRHRGAVCPDLSLELLYDQLI